MADKSSGERRRTSLDRVGRDGGNRIARLVLAATAPAAAVGSGGSVSRPGRRGRIVEQGDSIPSKRASENGRGSGKRRSGAANS